MQYVIVLKPPLAVFTLTLNKRSQLTAFSTFQCWYEILSWSSNLNMDLHHMWILKSGRKVEQVIYEFSRNLHHESYLHSFIINYADATTKNCPLTKNGRRSLARKLSPNPNLNGLSLNCWKSIHLAIPRICERFLLNHLYGAHNHNLKPGNFKGSWKWIEKKFFITLWL